MHGFVLFLLYASTIAFCHTLGFMPQQIFVSLSPKQLWLLFSVLSWPLSQEDWKGVKGFLTGCIVNVTQCWPAPSLWKFTWHQSFNGRRRRRGAGSQHPGSRAVWCNIQGHWTRTEYLRQLNFPFPQLVPKNDITLSDRRHRGAVCACAMGAWLELAVKKFP